MCDIDSRMWQAVAFAFTIDHYIMWVYEHYKYFCDFHTIYNKRHNRIGKQTHYVQENFAYETDSRVQIPILEAES